METQKIVNLLNGSDNESSKFATKKRYIINDQNGNGDEVSNDKALAIENNPKYDGYQRGLASMVY